MNADQTSMSSGELSATVIRTNGRNKCPMCGGVGEPLEMRALEGDYRCLLPECATHFTIPIRREELGVIARSE